MEKTIRNVKYLMEMLNDKFEEIGNCAEDCPYNKGCNYVIKEHGISLCGSIDKSMNNN